MSSASALQKGSLWRKCSVEDAQLKCFCSVGRAFSRVTILLSRRLRAAALERRWKEIGTHRCLRRRGGGARWPRQPTRPCESTIYVLGRGPTENHYISFRTGHVQNRPRTWCPNRASETAGPVPGSGRSCTGPIASILRALACAARSDLRRYPSVTSRFEVSAMA